MLLLLLFLLLFFATIDIIDIFDVIDVIVIIGTMMLIRFSIRITMSILLSSPTEACLADLHPILNLRPY